MLAYRPPQYLCTNSQTGKLCGGCVNNVEQLCSVVRCAECTEVPDGRMADDRSLASRWNSNWECLARSHLGSVWEVQAGDRDVSPAGHGSFDCSVYDRTMGVESKRIGERRYPCSWGSDSTGNTHYRKGLREERRVTSPRDVRGRLGNAPRRIWKHKLQRRHCHNR